MTGWRSFGEVLRHRAAETPERPMFTFLRDDGGSEETLSYGELDRRARAVAATLTGLARPGDCVMLVMPPGLGYVVGLCGCLYAGVTAVPAYPPRGRRDHRSQARLTAITADAEPVAALCGTELRGGLPGVPAERCLVVDELSTGEAEGACPRENGPDDVAVVQYTSGSTGSPRGVVLSHGNLLVNSEHIRDAFGHTPRSVGVTWLPPYHDMGLIGGLLQPLYAGFPVVMMSPTAFLQRPRLWLEAIGRYGATTSGGPDSAFDLCVQAIPPAAREGLDLSSWRVAFCGAEPVRVETLERFAEAFGPRGFRREAFRPVYGLAESTLLVTAANRPIDPVVREVDRASLAAGRIVAPREGGRTVRLLGCGRAAAGEEVRVVDPVSRDPRGPDDVGELWIAGPSVARGYWRNASTTDETFGGRLASGEGPYLRTGDLGFVDPDGELFVTGRLKDVVIVGGLNYHAEDVEASVDGCHPALARRAAVAFGDDTDGPEGLVVVAELTRQGLRADGLEVVAAVRRAVAAQHELLVRVVALLKPGALPRTSSGKVQRRLCRERYRAGALETAYLAAADWAGPATAIRRPRMDGVDATEDALRDLLAEHLGLPPDGIPPEVSLFYLGLSSLRVAQFQHALAERFGATYPLEYLLESTSTELLERLSGRAAPREVAGWAPPAWLFGRRRPPRVLDPIVRAAYRVLATDTRVLGGEHLAGLSGPAIFAHSHRSYLDQWAIRAALASTPARAHARSPLVVAAAEGLHERLGSLSWALVAGLGLCPVGQRADARAALAGLIHAARASGRSILIAPQGAHVWRSEELVGLWRADFRAGVGLLAEALGRPVVPCGLAGTERLIPPEPTEDFRGPVVAAVPLRLRRGPVAVAFGRPLRPEPGEAPRAFAIRLQEACFRLNDAAEAARASTVRSRAAGPHW